MIPTIGRIVHYTLTAQDADAINRRRADACIRSKAIAEERPGYVVHVGNSAAMGDVYPMMITRVWGDHEGAAVNGQVFLDGNDTIWVTSSTQGDGVHQWHEPPRA